MALIAVYVGTEQLLYIANTKLAFEQWWALKQVYEPIGTAQLAALLAAFHGYSQRPGHRVDKVASDLTTLQSDIRVINAGEAPTDTAKLITLTEMLLKSNPRYESTVLVLRQKVGITFEEAVLMLKQAEERILGTDNAAGAIETSLFTRGTSNDWGRNSALRKLFPKSKDRPKSNPRNWKPRGNPTRGNKECWHCGSQTHIRTSCPDWLRTPEGTKWAAKNPSKSSSSGSNKSLGGQGPGHGLWLVGASAELGPNSTAWLVDSGASS